MLLIHSLIFFLSTPNLKAPKFTEYSWANLRTSLIRHCIRLYFPICVEQMFEKFSSSIIYECFTSLFLLSKRIFYTLQKILYLIMCVYILSREILVVSKERNVINIHAMRNVVYVGFSKRQTMTKEILFF